MASTPGSTTQPGISLERFWGSRTKAQRRRLLKFTDTELLSYAETCASSREGAHPKSRVGRVDDCIQGSHEPS